MWRCPSTEQKSDNVRVLWNSILAQNASRKCQNEDEEIVKISLLLESTRELFSGLRVKELQCSAELKRLQDKVGKLESEKQALQEEVSCLKHKLQLQETKSKTLQENSDKASMKLERLQSSMSGKIEARLHAIFQNCLQQNKAATVFDMMTQMYQDTQVPESDLRSRTNLTNKDKNTYEGSPDVITATPDKGQGKRACLPLKKEVKPQTKKDISPVPKSICQLVASSPDEIAATPPVRFSKKDNKKRHERFAKLFKDHTEEIEVTGLRESENVKIYAKDTQEDEEARPVLKDNIVIPATPDPGSLETYEEKESRFTFRGKREKENEIISPGSTSGTPKTLADLSIDAKFPGTPKKSTHFRDRSPILGNSSGKKKSSRSLNSPNPVCPSTSESSRNFHPVKKKKPHHTSEHFSSQYEIQLEKTAHGKSTKAFRQLKINSRNRLSLSKAKNDVSKLAEFCGGQRSSPDVSVKMSELSDEDKLKIAINNSLKEKSFNERSSIEDDDPTMFEPNSSLLKQDQAVLVSDSVQKVNPNVGEKCIRAEVNSLETCFEPLFASTAREEVTPTKRKSPDNSVVVGEYATQNSQLENLVQMLDNDETAPFPLETSYDRLPVKDKGPNYAYKADPVRKKAERRNIPGVECTQCGKFYAAAFDPNDSYAKKRVVDQCSRHRDVNGPIPETQPGFWDLEFPCTAVIRERMAPSPELVDNDPNSN